MDKEQQTTEVMQDLLARTPTISQLRPAVLSVLADGMEHYSHQISQAIAHALDLDEDVTSARTKNSNRYRNRIGWALSGLVHAGLAESTRRAHYRITPPTARAWRPVTLTPTVSGTWTNGHAGAPTRPNLPNENNMTATMAAPNRRKRTPWEKSMGIRSS